MSFPRHAVKRVLYHSENPDILEIKSGFGRPLCLARIKKPEKTTSSSKEAINRHYTEAHKAVIKFQVVFPNRTVFTIVIKLWL